MADFGLVEPFDIDDGQLEGMSRQQIFILGFEMSEIRNRLLSGEQFRQVLNAGNAERITAMCERHGRFVEVAPTDYPEWVTLIVGSRKQEPMPGGG